MLFNVSQIWGDKVDKVLSNNEIPGDQTRLKSHRVLVHLRIKQHKRIGQRDELDPFKERP